MAMAMPSDWHQKYISNVTTIGQHCHGHVNSVNGNMKCHLKCKLGFPHAQFVLQEKH